MLVTAISHIIEHSFVKWYNYFYLYVILRCASRLPIQKMTVSIQGVKLGVDIWSEE